MQLRFSLKGRVLRAKKPFKNGDITIKKLKDFIPTNEEFLKVGINH